MSLVDMQLPTAILQTVYSLLAAIGRALIISISMPPMIPFIPLTIMVLYFLQRFYLRTSRQLRHLDLEMKAPLYTHFLEMLSGLTTIRAFGWQSRFNDRMCRLLDDSQRPHYLLYCVQRWLSIVLDFIVAIFAVSIIGFATLMPRSQASNDAALGVALVNLLTISSILSYLIHAWTDLETCIGAVVRIRDFEETTPKEQDSTPSNTHSLRTPPSAWPSKGAIQFTSVSISYNPTPTHPPILKDISLTIQPNTHTLIRGRTGSGKSTLLLSLFGMAETISGSITIDDIDISSIPRHFLRERIIAIPQAPDLFPGSLRENLDPARRLQDHEILDCLSFVDAHLADKILARGGLRLETEETGFSAGERQLLTLTSAILRKRGVREGDAGIVVLDELTSSVDLETEKRILEVVRKEFEGWTVISVAHRMEVGRDADMIVTLEDGRIVDIQ